MEACTHSIESRVIGVHVFDKGFVEIEIRVVFQLVRAAIGEDDFIACPSAMCKSAGVPELIH